MQLLSKKFRDDYANPNAQLASLYKLKLSGHVMKDQAFVLFSKHGLPFNWMDSPYLRTEFRFSETILVDRVSKAGADMCSIVQRRIKAILLQHIGLMLRKVLELLEAVQCASVAEFVTNAKVHENLLIYLF